MLSLINRGFAKTIAALFGFLGAITFASSGNPLALVFIIFGPLLAVTVHELGHAFAAWRLGMAVRAISVGPCVLRFKPLRVGMSDNLLGPDVGGYVLYDEGAGRYLTRRASVIITLAGPLANLISAIAAFAIAQPLRDQLAVGLLGGFGFVSFAAFVLSAWPFTLVSGRANDALEIVRDVRSARPRAKPNIAAAKRSPWQAP